MTYAKPSSIDTPHQSTLNGARAYKARMWKAVKILRERIENEPLGGNRFGLRVELLNAKCAHSEAQQMERDALRAIEVRANELGLTTIRAKAI